MSLDLVGFSPGDVDAAAISFPARDAGSVMLVSIGDALVVFLAEFVFVGVRIGIAAAPELFDKALPLVVSRELLESFSLLVGDDVSDVFLEPILVSLFQLRLDVARPFRRILALIAGLFLLRQARRQGKGQA